MVFRRVRRRKALSKINLTSIFLGTVPDNGVQAQLVLRSLKLLSWLPTLAKTGLLFQSGLRAFFYLSQNKTILKKFANYLEY